METILFKGNKYPARTLTIFSEDTDEMTVTIATAALTDAFCEEAGGSDEPDDWSKEAGSIDEEIYFYVDSEEILNLPGKELAANHLDEPFEYIEG
jgi:hypothetical protein